MLPKLQCPLVVSSGPGNIDIIWTLSKDYAPKLVEILWLEAKVIARSTVIDGDENMVSATYPESRKNFVIFACMIFSGIYNDCRQLSAMYDKEQEEAST